MYQNPQQPGYPPQQQPQPAPQPQAAPQPQPGYPPQQPQPVYQQPQPVYQPPQQPQPQPGYPPQQAQPVYQQPQPGYPPQQAQPQPPPQLAAPPALHHIDHDQMMADYKNQQAQMPTGGLSGWFEMPGPNGAPKWDKSVPNGFEQTAMVHVCGPWAPGKKLYVPRPTHFWKSHAFPKGTSVVCGCVVGKDQCQICNRISQLMEHADASMQKKLRDAGRVRWNFLYNVCWLENIEAHRAEDGGLSALKLEAVKGVHDKLIQIFNGAGGAMSVCDYQNGWPVQLIKKKTGTEVMNVDWDAMPSMGGRQPLPQEFWGAASRLTDLEQLIALPTDQEAEMALNDMGLGGIMTGATQVPANYPGGQTPPNPYPQPQMPPAQGGFPQAGFGGPSPVPTPQPPLPAGMAPQPAYQPPVQQPPVQQPPMQPVPPQAAPGSVPGMVAQPYPEGTLPPPAQQQPQPGPQMSPPPAGPPMAAGGPPQMAPPAVSSGAPPVGPPAGVSPPPVTSQPAAGYEAQPGNVGMTEGQPMPMGDAPPAPAPVPGVPASAPAPAAQAENFVDSPRPLQVPLPPGTQLSGGRERCFGLHNETDRSCQECPDWIKLQCLPASGQAVAPANDPALAAVQHQAVGK